MDVRPRTAAQQVSPEQEVMGLFGARTISVASPRRSTYRRRNGSGPDRITKSAGQARQVQTLEEDTIGVRITDDEMIGDTTPHRAKLAGEWGYWRVSWAPLGLYDWSSALRLAVLVDDRSRHVARTVRCHRCGAAPSLSSGLGVAAGRRAVHGRSRRLRARYCFAAQRVPK